jgi:hypothetical protein
VGWTPGNKRCAEETQAPNKHIDPLNLRLDSAAGIAAVVSMPWFTLSSRIWETFKNIRLRASGFNDSVFSGGGDSSPSFTKILGKKAERGRGEVSPYGS